MSGEGFLFSCDCRVLFPWRSPPKCLACKSTFPPVPLYGMTHAMNHLEQCAPPWVYPTLRAYQGGVNNTLYILILLHLATQKCVHLLSISVRRHDAFQNMGIFLFFTLDLGYDRHLERDISSRRVTYHFPGPRQCDNQKPPPLYFQTCPLGSLPSASPQGLVR